MKIIYVHGINNKPEKSVLKCIWDMALFGQKRDNTFMAYWVDRLRYPMPLIETCPGEDPSYDETFSSYATRSSIDESSVNPALTAEQQLFLRLENRLLTDEVRTSDLYDPQAGRVLPLPPVIRRRVTSAVTHTFIRDSYDFLCRRERRAEMVSSITDLVENDEEFVLIAHSQGSLIAYEALASGALPNQVRLFLTIGSPLGIEEVVDYFKLWRGPIFVPKNVVRWVNVSDSDDFITQNKRLSHLYDRGDFIEEHIRSGLNLRHDDKHSIVGYFCCGEIQNVVTEFA